MGPRSKRDWEGLFSGFFQVVQCFYIGISQYQTWKHTQLIIDVIEGHGGTFSLEGPEGKAFHTRSRVFTPEEMVELARQEAADQAGV